MYKGHYFFTYKGQWLGPNPTSTLCKLKLIFVKNRKKNLLHTIEMPDQAAAISSTHKRHLLLFLHVLKKIQIAPLHIRAL